MASAMIARVTTSRTQRCPFRTVSLAPRRPPRAVPAARVNPVTQTTLPAEAKIEQPLDRYRWRFLNHSCEPNAEFAGRNLVAIRKIKPSEQITFDYNTTENDLSSPFECHCESDNCCGVVRGYRWQRDQAKAEG